MTFDAVSFGIATLPYDRVDASAGTDVVCIFVNGRELRDIVSAAQAADADATALYSPPPASWVLPPRRHRLDQPDPRLTKGRWSVVYTCSCGDWECGALMARIRIDDDLVAWSDFLSPHELDLLAEDPRRATQVVGARRRLGPYRFDRTQYESALGSAERVAWPYPPPSGTDG
jgi:hypothetical protein